MGARDEPFFLRVLSPDDVRPSMRVKVEEAKAFAESDLGVEFDLVYFEELTEVGYRALKSHEDFVAAIAEVLGEERDRRFLVAKYARPVWGMYAPGANFVYVNTATATDHVVRTLFHEARHCLQHTVEHPGASTTDVDMIIGREEAERQAEAYAEDASERFRALRHGGGWEEEA